MTTKPGYTPKNYNHSHINFRQHCLLELWFCLSLYNISLHSHAKHIPGSTNTIADHLSHGQSHPCKVYTNLLQTDTGHDTPVLDSIFKFGIDLGQHVAHPAKGCKMYCFFTVSLSFRGFAKSTTIHQNTDHNLRQKTY